MEYNRIIVALDGIDDQGALALVDRLAGGVRHYKIGLELFTRHGPKLVDQVRSKGKEVFLDLKFHDIPATVAGAVRAACEAKPSMLTLHAAGGPAMIEAAVAARGDRQVKILAVTVLTSSEGDEVPSRVLDLARRSQDSGADGVVASALEARAIKETLGREFLVVTPGIRPAGADRHDQARVATPAEAIASGADFLVVGRPVTKAHDPLAALEGILVEISSGGRPS
ncbi:MAG: orotidine-5'-phosphate decarboxylase [Candidatus Eisenbacteria bacterium]